MSPVDAFKQAVERRHQYAQQWKASTGGKVVGYLCAYVPEELLHAAGILPVRVLGGHEPQDVTEPYVFSMFCPYCRDVLAQGLQGRYSYLDGLVLTHCCPQIRQTYDSWRWHAPVEFSHLMWVPSLVQSRHALDYFLGEVTGFKEAVEAWVGAPLDPAALSRAVEVYNLNRRLLRQLYELRKSHPPALSGAEAMEVVLASKVMDKSEHSELLRQLLASPPGGEREGVRLMVLGSENDDVELIRFLESLGGVVVMEDNCITNRYFWNEVNPDGDRLAAIAARYLDKLPCPLRDISQRRRSGYLLELAREFAAQGVVILRQKFCDPHAWEIPVVQQAFQEAGLPVLILELDVTVPLGQYRTRFEAFTEMLL